MSWLDGDSSFLGESSSDKKAREDRKSYEKAQKSTGFGGYGTWMCKGCGKAGIPNGKNCPKCG